MIAILLFSDPRNKPISEHDWAWWDQSLVRIASGILGGLMLILPVVLRWWLELLDRRHRDIRLLLGRHPLGSSDPVDWTSANLQRVRSPQEIFGTKTFGEAVPQALESGDFGRAMFAARLTGALGNRAKGEELTDVILKHPQVATALERIRRKPPSRDEFLPHSEWQSAHVFGG
jgi:hypothetical protein